VARVFRMLALLPPLAAIGCQGMNTPIYFNGPTGADLLTADGTEDLPPHNGLTLRFRNPTQKERDALAKERQARGYDMDIPWIAADKVHVELSYIIKNTGDRDGVATLMVNGASEFVKYDMDVVAMALTQGNNNAPTLLPLMSSAPQTIPAGGSVSGLIREDDFVEAQRDLDALGRWLADDTFAGVLINRSDVNPVGTENMPANLVVPAMAEIDVSLLVGTSGIAMTAEYVVRVRDDDDRLLHLDGDSLYQISPTLFQPAIMMN
jgi:hypothetical protein